MTRTQRALRFARTHATRLYAVAVALLALATNYVPGLPVELILGVIFAGLGLGEGVQRVENKKHAGKPTMREQV